MIINLTKRNKILLFLCFFLIINYIFFNYRILFRENGYILSDWLINYSAGFVRRGFLGQIFYIISYKFNLNIIQIVFVFSSIIYISFIYLYYLIVKDKLSNNSVFLFLLLPSTLLFNFFDPLSVGRKDILLLFLVCLYYVCFNKIKDNIKYQIIFFILCLISMLTHEIFFFYTPYLFAIAFINYKETFSNFKKIKNYYLEIIIFISSLFIMFIIVLFSHKHNNQLLCSSLLKLGLNQGVCHGVISEFANKAGLNILHSYFIEKNYYQNYFIYFLLTFLPLFVGYIKQKNNLYKIYYLFFSIFCLFFSLPFILIVNDWGRYFNIHFLLQLLLFLKFSEFNTLSNDKIKIISHKIILVPMIIIYLTVWHMPHCCNPKLGKGYFNIFERIKFRLFDNSTESTKYNDYPRIILRKIFKIQ